MKSSTIVASTLGLACAAVWLVSTPLYARGPGGGHAGGHSAGRIGGVHHGGVHVGGARVVGIHHGSFYGAGIYRSGIYGLGYGINGYGLGGYGLGSSYYNYSYSSPGVIYTGSPLLLGSANPDATQVISLYPSIDNSGGAGAAITKSRPVIQGNDGTGSIVLRVPANAEVWWNGTRTVSGGVERLFGTLPLSSEGQVHRFEAKWTDRNGQAVSQVREIRALPNQAVVLDFNVPLQTNPTPATAIQPGGADPSGVPNLPPVPDPFK